MGKFKKNKFISNNNSFERIKEHNIEKNKTYVREKTNDVLCKKKTMNSASKNKKAKLILTNTSIAKKEESNSDLYKQKNAQRGARNKQTLQKLKKEEKNSKIKVNSINQIDDITVTCAAAGARVPTKEDRKTEAKQAFPEKPTRDLSLEAATVFVGNLPVNVKRIQLVHLFKQFSPVNSIRLRSAGGTVLLKHKHRKTAGSLNAYVVLKDKESAEKALSLNGVEFKGHHLMVTLSANNQRNLANEKGKNTVFVGNLQYSATEESLHKIFSNCGEIDYVRCIRDGHKGCRGIAFVCFKKADAVGLALELNGTILDERPINVERFSIKKASQSQNDKTNSTGAKQRLKGKTEKTKNAIRKTQNSLDVDVKKKKKKSEFRGIKVNDLKKKQKSRKKKSKGNMLKLAKQIAPKLNS